MKVAIVGSRSIEKLPNQVIERLKNLRPTHIISGGAKGTDTLASLYAKENGIKLTEYLPDYEKYGKPATHIRNKEIVQNADTIVIVWDGESKGTLNVKKLAKQMGKNFFFYKNGILFEGCETIIQNSLFPFLVGVGTNYNNSDIFYRYTEH
jgi:predicted Rossmann fold nucleotide-binding protein DprA/Smf involved in DNA uptake